MTATPRADVVTIRGRLVTIACPYCGGRHDHTVAVLGRSERFAPGCGMYRSPSDRLTGYRFTTREGSHG